MNSHSKFDTFLFGSSSPYPLALCRVLFFGWLFLWYLNFDFTLIAYYPSELWRPMQVLRWTQLDFIPGADSLAVVQGLWKASLLLAAFGLLTRFSIATAFTLGAYLLALTHSFNKINHSDGLLVIAMGVLVFSRSSDVLSLDRLLRTRLTKSRATPPSSSGEYTWPFRVIQIAWVCLFLGSGISKLKVGGLDWMFSDNLQNILAYCQLTRDPLLLVNLPYPLLFKALAVATVVFELLSPLALFHRGARAFLVPSLLGMQIGIRLTMGDNFTQFMAIYLFWIPWMALYALAARSRTARAPEPGFAAPTASSWIQKPLADGATIQVSPRS